MIRSTSCWLTDHTATILTSSTDDFWVVDSQLHQTKWSMRNEPFQKLLINGNTKTTLPSMLKCEVWVIHNFR